jgi:hypothetical protein
VVNGSELSIRSVLETLADKGSLFDSTVMLAAMDEVEREMASPFCIGIVNLKPEIWRYTDDC